MGRDKNIGMEHGESTDMEGQKKVDQYRLQKTRDRRDSDQSNRQQIECCPEDNKPGQKGINCCAQDDESALKAAQRGNDEAEIDEVDTDNADINKQSRAVGMHNHHHQQVDKNVLASGMWNFTLRYPLYALFFVFINIILDFLILVSFVYTVLESTKIEQHKKSNLKKSALLQMVFTLFDIVFLMGAKIKLLPEELNLNDDKYVENVQKYIAKYYRGGRYQLLLYMMTVYLVVDALIGIFQYCVIGNFNAFPYLYGYIFKVFIRVIMYILLYFWYMPPPPTQGKIDEFKYSTYDPDDTWDYKKYPGLFPPKYPHALFPLSLVGDAKKINPEYSDYVKTKFDENGLVVNLNSCSARTPRHNPTSLASMLQISSTSAMEYMLHSTPLSCTLLPAPSAAESMSEPNPLSTLQLKTPTAASTVDSMLQATLPSSMLQPTSPAAVSMTQIVPSTTASVMQIIPSLEPPPLRPDPAMSEPISPTVASTVDSMLRSTLPSSMLQPIPPLEASMLQSPTHPPGCIMDSIMDSIAQSASPIAASMQPNPAATAATQPTPVTEV